MKNRMGILCELMQRRALRTILWMRYTHTIDEVFGERVISLGLWPPRSPDLNHGDMHGACWNSVWEQSSLQEGVRHKISAIPVLQLRHVSGNILSSFEAYLEAEGLNFETLLQNKASWTTVEKWAVNYRLARRVSCRYQSNDKRYTLCIFLIITPVKIHIVGLLGLWNRVFW
jgi:hypothetical protein